MLGSSSTISTLGLDSILCCAERDEISVMFANLISSGNISARDLLHARDWLEFLAEDAEGRGFGPSATGHCCKLACPMLARLACVGEAFGVRSAAADCRFRSLRRAMAKSPEMPSRQPKERGQVLLLRDSGVKFGRAANDLPALVRRAHGGG